MKKIIALALITSCSMYGGDNVELSTHTEQTKFCQSFIAALKERNYTPDAGQEKAIEHALNNFFEEHTFSPGMLQRHLYENAGIPGRASKYALKEVYNQLSQPQIIAIFLNN